MGAPRFNAASLKHKEDHLLLPTDIIIDESWNGRFEPHTDEEIRDRAIDMVVNGQIAPVGIRKAHDEKGKPKLVFGFLRAKASLYINDTILPEGGIEYLGQHYEVTKPFMLWAAAAEGNDVESLKKNIRENLMAKGTTIMDMVSNQARLLQANNGDYDEVATLYKTSVEVVKRNQMLLSLPKEIQTMIHRGLIAAEAGFHLLTVTPEEQKKIIAKVKDDLDKSEGAPLFNSSEQSWLHHVPGEESENANFGQRTGVRSGFAEDLKPAGKGKGKGKGKGAKSKKGGKQRSLLSTKAIKAGVREVKEAKGEKGPGNSLSEIMSFFSGLVGPDADPVIPDEIKDLAGAILKFRRAEISQRQMLNALYKLYETKPAKVRA